MSQVHRSGDGGPFRVGCDVCSLERIDRMARLRPGLMAEIFTDDELDRCAGDVSRLAMTFAAKEATLKALGVGVTSYISLHDLRTHDDDASSLWVSLDASRHVADVDVEVLVHTWHDDDDASAIAVLRRAVR